MISPTDDSAPVKVAKGAALIFAGLIVARLLNYAYRIVLARAGGMEEFGLLFLGISTVAVAGGLAGLGLGHGVARFIPLYIGSDDRPRLRGTLRFAIILSVIAGLGAAAALKIAGPWIALNLLGNEPLVKIMHICALCLPFTVGAQVLVKAVVAFQRIGYRVTVSQVLNPLVRLLLTIALVCAGMGAQGAMLAYLAGEMLSFAALFFILEKRVFPVFTARGGKGEKVERVFEPRAFMAYCLPLFLSGIIDLVMNYTDAFMTDYFLDNTQVGLYGAAVTLTSLAALGTELVNPMFLSIITREYARRNHARIVSAFNNNNRWFFYITMPIAALLAALPGETMVLLWGESFAAGARALAILTIGRAIFYLANTSGFIISMHGAARLILSVNIVSAALNVGLNLLLIPRLGITGAALATAAAMTVHSVLLILAARIFHRGQGMRVFFPAVIAAAVVPAALCAGLKGFLPPGWLALIGLGLGFTAVYILLLKVFRVFSEEDYHIQRAIVAWLRGEREK